VESTAPRTASLSVETSTLSNGARVVTVQSGAFAPGLALFIKAGPRYETREDIGVSHFAKHMAFQRTATRSPIYVVRDMEILTGEYTSVATRESLVFAARLRPENLSTVQKLMADSLQPIFHEYIIRDLVPQIEFESRLAEEDPNTIFTETVHSTAFRHAGLGRPLHCPSNKAAEITPDQVKDFWSRRVYNPAHHTWVGVGVSHQDITGALEAQSVASSPPPPSVYVGGDATLYSATNTRVGIVFKGLSENDNDVPALAVLSALTGGDARYSKDGPGRGVASRLYKNVLQKHDSMLSTATINASYSDAGLWGVYAEAAPGNAAKVAELLTKELVALKKGSINAQEFEGAKNRAKVTLLHELECPKGLLHYLGRKGSAPGTLLKPTEFLSRLDKLTVEEVSVVAKKVLSSEVTLVGVGDVEGLPLSSSIKRDLS